MAAAGPRRVDDQKVELVIGTFLSNIGLTIGDFALQNEKLFVAGGK
jgi:hypothetical protein